MRIPSSLTLLWMSASTSRLSATLSTKLSSFLRARAFGHYFDRLASSLSLFAFFFLSFYIFFQYFCSRLIFGIYLFVVIRVSGGVCLMCVIILNVRYRIVINKPFCLSPAIMISHPMPCIDPLLEIARL